MTEASWYVLVVRAGMERAAATAVQRKGAEVFLPGERRWVQPSRRARGDKKREVKAFVSWPGYVFMGMPGWLAEGRGWDDVLALDLVVGVLSTQRCVGNMGAYRQWERAPLQLSRRWRADTAFEGLENLAEEAAGDPAAPPALAIGDEVIVPHEAFNRYPGKIVVIDEANVFARVLMRFLGGEREVKAALEDLVRAKDSIRSA